MAPRTTTTREVASSIRRDQEHFNSKCLEGSPAPNQNVYQARRQAKAVKETITDEDGKDMSQAACNDPTILGRSSSKMRASTEDE